MDEKPGSQALERATGSVETDNGKLVRGFKSTSKRHGTLNLFAALQVATGEIKANTTTLKRREEFLQFMDQIVADAPPDRQLHVILDNYCTHKKCDAWRAQHPNVHFHFTPTSASWLKPGGNLVRYYVQKGAARGELQERHGTSSGHRGLHCGIQPKGQTVQVAQA